MTPNESPAALLPEGRRIAIARDEFFASLSGATLSGAPTGVYLRNRLELAFIEGWKAAKLDASTAPAASESRVEGLADEWFGAFVRPVAQLLRCLPAYFPAGNEHILRKLRELIAASESRGSVPDVPRRCRHRDTAAGVRWRCDLADGHEGKHVMVGDDPDAKCMRCGERRGDHDDSTPCVAAPTPPAVASGEPTAEQWRTLVDELATDLENEIENRRAGEVPRRIERDLEIVREARRMLARSAAAKGEG